jgi:CRP/FNR family transcriptional regulator, cyclic AMP receptor protein
VPNRKLETVIATVPVFESLSKRHLKRIAGLMSTDRYHDGATVIKQGDPGDAFYVTVEGRAKVVVDGKTVHRLIPGDHFGEISLLDGGERSATIVTETPVTLLRLSRSSFLKVVRNDPDLARALLASLARMVRRVDRSLGR